MCNACPPEVEVRSIAPICATRRYVPGLDGLRGIAVLLVILFHCKPEGPFGGGFLGVDLFFVLSAFLITSILVEEQERTGAICLSQFYWRRTLRLMPGLLFFLSTYAVVAPMILPGYPHLRDALVAELYVSNFAYVAGQFPIFIKHTWSLAAREQFYLLWPLMLMVLLRWRRPALLLAVAWAALTAMRFMTDDWIVYYYGFAHHGTGLVLGAILFFLVREGKVALRPFHALFAAGIMAMLAVNAQLGGSALAITVAEFASAVTWHRDCEPGFTTSPRHAAVSRAGQAFLRYLFMELPDFPSAPGNRQLRVNLCDYSSPFARAGEPILCDD